MAKSSSRIRIVGRVGSPEPTGGVGVGLRGSSRTEKACGRVLNRAIEVDRPYLLTSFANRRPSVVAPAAGEDGN